MTEIQCFECPVFGLLFGGSNLVQKENNEKFLICPVCGQKHQLTEENQIIEEKTGWTQAKWDFSPTA